MFRVILFIWRDGSCSGGAAKEEGGNKGWYNLVGGGGGGGGGSSDGYLSGEEAEHGGKGIGEPHLDRFIWSDVMAVFDL